MKYMRNLFLVLMSVVLNLQASEGWLYLDKLDPLEKAKKIEEIHIPQVLLDAQYQAAKDFTDVMHDTRLPYVVLFGTQLGASRHEGLIPWDDDFDTGISIKHVEALKKLESVFRTMGYDLILDSEEIVGYKLVSQKEIKTEINGKGVICRPFVDIFLYQKNNQKGVYELFFEKGRQLFSKNNIKIEDFLKRRLYNFGPLKVWGLENSKSRLSHFYGESWNEIGVYCHSHHTHSRENRYVWTLSEEDKKPALPSGKLEENYEKIKKQLYWDEFYKKSVGISKASTFAQFLVEKGYFKEGETLVDVGCGSGRDTVYFRQQKIQAVGIDESSQAVKRNNKLVENEFSNEEFFKVADVRRLETLTPYQGYQHVYARFFLHAIMEEEQDIFMQFLKTLNVGAFIYLEFRTDKDPLFLKAKEGKTDHYRRFINLEAFHNVLVKDGFKISYESEEGNLSPYGDDNPVLARLIFSKI